jgi:hypothetical protein
MFSFSTYCCGYLASNQTANAASASLNMAHSSSDADKLARIDLPESSLLKLALRSSRPWRLFCPRRFDSRRSLIRSICSEDLGPSNSSSLPPPDTDRLILRLTTAGSEGAAALSSATARTRREGPLVDRRMVDLARDRREDSSGTLVATQLPGSTRSLLQLL